MNPSLLRQRWERNIDTRVDAKRLLSDVKFVQDSLRGDIPYRKRNVERACERISKEVDLMILKFIYKPKPGNGNFVGYTCLEEILNEARLQCLRAILDFKFDYRKSDQIFCYLTYTIMNAARQTINSNTRIKDIKFNWTKSMMEDKFANNDYNNICKIDNPNDFDQYLDDYSRNCGGSGFVDERAVYEE